MKKDDKVIPLKGKKVVNDKKVVRELSVIWYDDGERKIKINSDTGVYVRDLEQSFPSQLNAVREHNNKLARKEIADAG